MKPAIPSLHDQDLVPGYPETIVTALLRSAIAATRRALASAHPEIGDDALDLRFADQPGRLAFVLALNCVEIDRLVDAYHLSLRDRDVADQIYQLDLPF